MKYIKTFNESFENDIEIIKDITESSLVYLMDEGFTIDYSSPNMSTDIIYSNLVVNIKISTPSGIKWNNIKDYFIALLQRLKDAYGLKDTCFFEFNEPIPFQVPGVGRRSMDINTNILLRDSVYSHSSTNPFWWDVFGELFIKSISIRVEKED